MHEVVPSAVSAAVSAAIAMRITTSQNTYSSLVFEGAEFALDGEALGAFLDVADDLGVDVERTRKGNDLFCDFRTDIDLHAVPHVEHLVHLAPVGA